VTSHHDILSLVSRPRCSAFVLLILLSVSACGRAPNPCRADSYPTHRYTAPVLNTLGQKIGTSTMSYRVVPFAYPDGTVKPTLEVPVYWSCTVEFRRYASGGGLLFEIRDDRGHDWAVGCPRANDTMGDPIAVVDSALVPVDIVPHLRAPHWHLLCDGKDWDARCGESIEVRRQP
jgi:hypothetical protein